MRVDYGLAVRGFGERRKCLFFAYARMGGSRRGWGKCSRFTALRAVWDGFGWPAEGGGKAHGNGCGMRACRGF